MRRYVVAALLTVIIAAVFAYILPYKTFLTAEIVSSDDDFGGVSLRIEYATTREAYERGLSGRENIAPNEAMLFVFTRDDKYGFWMKDMRMPLDIFWLDSQGQVVHIAQNVATSTYPNVLYPSVPARYVLETAAGFARVNSIATGTSLSLKNLKRVSQ